MNFLNKLERKFGRRGGIPNLTLYMVIGYVIGYFLEMINPVLMGWLTLEPALILRGQIWRLVTWVISPPGSTNVFFFALTILFFYYPIGTSMERAWGSFRYTLYILSGMLFTIIGAFLLYFIYPLPLGYSGAIFSTYYVSTSIFLAYAATFPNMQLLLWFVIPIKVKWMAYVYVAIIAYDMINYVRRGMWFMVVPVMASLLNFVLFFFGTRDMSRYNPKEIKRKREFRKAMEPQGRVNPSTGGVSKHKCAICGRTELDDPSLEFRFCSKCNGNYEYCQDHLFTHEHVK